MESLNVLERSGESISCKMRTGLEKRKQSLETRLKKIADSIAKRSYDVADFRMQKCRNDAEKKRISQKRESAIRSKSSPS